MSINVILDMFYADRLQQICNMGTDTNQGRKNYLNELCHLAQPWKNRENLSIYSCCTMAAEYFSNYSHTKM